MKKEELMECINTAFDYGKRLLVKWNDLSMQQIRLETANLRKIELSRQANIEEMDERKTARYKLQKEANYNKWKNSSNYDKSKDVRRK